MKRTEMINTVGVDYLISNIENEEFSYPKAYKDNSLEFKPISNSSGNRTYEKLDIRFVKDGISLLIETKVNFEKDKTAETQLAAYVEYEKNLTGNKIIAILANTSNNKIKVWRGAISESNLMEQETTLRTMDEYIDFYTSKINDKEKVMKNTYNLNILLHKHGISEKLRSQFVGTCLLALKNGIDYKSPTIKATQVVAGIKEVLGELLTDDINKAGKLALLDTKVLMSQDIRSLKIADLREILKYIEEKILPFINDKSTAGQDLLNLFFITFNKYVGKDDKNQAFTPDHITDFMAKITGVNKNSVILDPCCGSGSFLVRSMTQALDDCATSNEQENIKKHQIFGIEYDESIYGLATTNMLIHGDGNSNIINGSCFDYKDWIMEARPNIILMNPPYNAQKKHMPKEYTDTWSSKQKEDPTKGIYFVKYIADILNECKIQATIAVLLPIACAIGNSKEIKNIKAELLENNTLDAVFTLPNEIFYPGASASACCMIFKTGRKNSSSGETFFGYYKEDGFKKKKNLGRIEQIDSSTGKSEWTTIESQWIDLYNNRRSVDGLSVTQKVTSNDEWLCEAYMKTDYTKLTDDDFQTTINNYLAYLIKRGKIYET
ncbi:HsdM family class I SAM-dependent methyltransferase [Paraclostridium sordellii]|uniref:HsdM family class I SAM-dependent methyltransferase n=1 Tax=Paraclostridium sordellii TaxID=1505 RepID=UPI0005DC04D6|nr:N-6 DNA methylase [Paeniclostridium sordellii]CEP85342.1 type i restriction enzyme m subunit [[Clostridium] sordellii] [Paeniclostridium sordellii]